MLDILLVYSCWASLGLLGVPGAWAHWSRKYNLNEEREDLGSCVISALAFGPVGTVMMFFLTGFYEYGLKFKFNDGYIHKDKRR
jgi:hypothetical protein